MARCGSCASWCPNMQPPSTEPGGASRVAHVSSVHARYDVRIFLKECASLARHGHPVHLYVADGKGEETRGGVHIHDVGKGRGRLRRMLFRPWVLRSEEHTSELQSLMRISYAVFCLKKKTTDDKSNRNKLRT